MLHSSLSIIDDHEIVELSGYETPLNIKNLTEKLLHGDFLEKFRYRPVYRILRTLECFFVQDNAYYWHLNRIFFALLTFIAVYHLFSYALSPISAAVVSLLIFAGKQNEIWLRLGAAEAYAVLFVLAGMVFVFHQCKRGKYRFSEQAPGLFCFLLAGYTKENFVVLLPLLPLILLALKGVTSHFGWRESLSMRALFKSRKDWMLLGLFIFFTCFLLYRLSLAASEAIQIEGHQWFPVVRHQKTRELLWNLVPLLMPVPFLLLSELKLSKSIGIFFAFIGLGLLISLPQWLIYGELVRLHERYLVPGIFGPILISGISFYFLEQQDSRKSLRVISIVLLVLFEVDWLYATSVWGNREATANRNYQSEIERITVLEQKSKRLPLVFCSNLWNYEQLHATRRYLNRLRAPESKIYIKMDEADGERKLGFERWTAERFKRSLDDGSSPFLKTSRQMDDPSCCIGVYFSGRPDLCPYHRQLRISELFLH